MSAEAPQFRRRAVAPRRRRRRALGVPPAYRLVLLGALAALAIHWMLTSPSLALRRVQPGSAAQVPAGWIEQQLAPFIGANLVQLPLERIERRLAAHPWVASVRLRKQLPDLLEVQIVEKVPAALFVHVDGSVLVDAYGNRIASYAAGQSASLLVVRMARPDLEAFWVESELLRGAIDLAAVLRGAHATWSRGLRAIEVLGGDDYRVLASGVPFPVVVRASAVDDKVRLLDLLLDDIERRVDRIAAVDLRFTGRIVVQPEGSQGALHG